MVENFWQNKKVLVTGADGFIGGNITKELVDLGAEVFALVRTENQAKNPIFLGCESKVKKVTADVCNFDQINKIFQENKIDSCFHLAAQPIVSEAFANPLPTFEVNIHGTINILEAARRSEFLKGLVIASTTHVYGDNKNLPYLESYFPQPSRPYETSKACADILTQTYYYTYGLPVAISRCTNTYGPGDMNFSRLIPKTIKSLLSNQNPEIIDGHTKRDFIYIKDVVSAYLTLAENLGRSEVRGQAFNFGSGQVHSALDLAEKILQVINRDGLEIKVIPGELKKEIEEQYVSIAKAKALLGWEPQYSLEHGLKETWEWYEKNKN